jgi:hypothetical protein
MQAIESIAGNVAKCQLLKDDIEKRLEQMNVQQKVRAEKLMQFLDDQSDLLLRLEEQQRALVIEIEALKRIAL